MHHAPGRARAGPGRVGDGVPSGRLSWFAVAPGFGAGLDAGMFSHIVIFWTKPEVPDAVEQLLAGMERYLRPIPGVLSFHAGRMVPSHRPVVDQTYQVGLNIVFPDKATQDAYQVHPLHVEFVEKVFKRVCDRVVVYDFA